ncbi:hypothetical protein E0Z10_g9122 [Xylaria hypoxylon]|uniref:Uncharacterized protein n=1 Tax=Xylaria hypoxylon TaxID=37992 RepID=A0A4Z0YJV4_9PEZI|nr:hypothetical protein E0Z10_g9122 [Xylaria hypoxylon]
MHKDLSAKVISYAPSFSGAFFFRISTQPIPNAAAKHTTRRHQQIEDGINALGVREQQPVELRTPEGQQGPHRFRTSSGRKRRLGAHRRYQDRDLPYQGLRKDSIAHDDENSAQQILYKYQEGDRDRALGWRDCVLH